MTATTPDEVKRAAEGAVEQEVERPARRLLDHAPRPVQIGVAAVRAFFADDGLTWASGMAFYLVLSIPPLLVAFGALLTLVLGQTKLVEQLLGQVATIVPGEGALIERVAATQGRDVAVAGAVSLGLVLVSGSRIFGILVTAIEGIWDLPKEGRFVERQVLRFLLLAVAGGLLVSATVVGAWLGPVGADLTDGAALLWPIARAIPLAVVFAGLAILYRTVPPGRSHWRPALAGAAVVAVLLGIAQLAFTGVIRYSSGFENVYGPLAGIALLMTWAVVASATVVLGAEIVVTIERPNRVAELGRGRPGTAGNRGRKGRARD